MTLTTLTEIKLLQGLGEKKKNEANGIHYTFNFVLLILSLLTSFYFFIKNF